MKPIQHILFIFSSLLILAPSNISAQEIGNYIEQYEGYVGTSVIKVNLLRIGKKSNNEVLIQVTGVDDPIDSLIFKYKREWKQGEKRLHAYEYVTTQIPGNTSFSVFHSDSYLGKQVFYILLTDDPGEAIEIYPTSHPEDLDPKVMYRQYLEQQLHPVKNGMGLFII